MKCAVVTVAVGEKYLKEYNQLFRANTEDYCKRNGYDFHVITDYIFEDPKYRQPVFVDIMKWTIAYAPQFQMYDRIAIVDADILITPNCPPLESLDLKDTIGVVNEYTQPSPLLRHQLQIINGHADTTPTEYYKHHLGIDIGADAVFNGGLLIVSPKHHGEWFRTIFNRHADGTLTAKHHPFHYEQASLGVELIDANNTTVLDNRWNVIWPIAVNPFIAGSRPVDQLNRELYQQSYMVHYCGRAGWEFADQVRIRE